MYIRALLWFELLPRHLLRVRLKAIILDRSGSRNASAVTNLVDIAGQSGPPVHQPR